MSIAREKLSLLSMAPEVIDIRKYEIMSHTIIRMKKQLSRLTIVSMSRLKQSRRAHMGLQLDNAVLGSIMISRDRAGDSDWDGK